MIMTDDDMLALVVRGHRDHGLERRPRPEPGPGEALVATDFAAMCGTDLRLLDGTLHDAEYPVIPGHEWSGTVLAAPDRPELVGRAVVGDNFRLCGRCPACLAGRPNLCTDIDEVGFTRPGAFAQLFTIPAANLVALPPQVPGPQACLLEPLGVALHAVERAGAVSGRSVGVIGAGTIGLLVAQLARGAGASRVRVADPLQSRRRIAADLGVDADPGIEGWHPDLPEVVFDATGAAGVFPRGLTATAVGGVYVLVGYSGAEAVTVEPSTVMLRELTVQGVLSGQGQLRTALAKVVAGEVRLGPLTGDPVPLTSYRSVLERDGPAPLRLFFHVGGDRTAGATSQEQGVTA